jgi:hypothetical protein
VSPGRSLWRFLLLTAIGHEVSYGLVKADRLDDAGQRLTNLWVGLTLAGIYRPNLLSAAGGRRASLARQVATLAADTVLIAVGTRWWQDGLAVLQREILTRPPADIEPAPRIERSMLPGISIRS